MTAEKVSMTRWTETPCLDAMSAKGKVLWLVRAMSTSRLGDCCGGWAAGAKARVLGIVGAKVMGSCGPAVCGRVC